jgi:hypothetical protein
VSTCPVSLEAGAIADAAEGGLGRSCEQGHPFFGPSLAVREEAVIPTAVVPVRDRPHVEGIFDGGGPRQKIVWVLLKFGHILYFVLIKKNGLERGASRIRRRSTQFYQWNSVRYGVSSRNTDNKLILSYSNKPSQP